MPEPEPFSEAWFDMVEKSALSQARSAQLGRESRSPFRQDSAAMRGQADAQTIKAGDHPMTDAAARAAERIEDDNDRNERNGGWSLGAFAMAEIIREETAADVRELVEALRQALTLCPIAKPEQYVGGHPKWVLEMLERINAVLAKYEGT